MDAMRAELEDWVALHGVVGARVGIRRPGLHDAFVVAGLDGRHPPTAMTSAGSFRIASVTKTFTSALVLDLVDRGRLDLDATLDRFVQDFPRSSEITIRTLLDHTAGTADPLFDDLPAMLAMLLADLDRSFTPAEVIAIAAEYPPYARPGDEYRYSNTDYHLLGIVVEHVTGRPFADCVTTRFSGPLGLHRTRFERGSPGDLVHGWFDLDSDGTPDPARRRDHDVLDFPSTALVTSAHAAGGLTSTLDDLLTWGSALYLGDALSPTMRAALLASPVHADPGGGTHGFGVFGFGERSDDGCWTAYGHPGNIIGSSTLLASFPDTRCTVVVHANVQELSTTSLAELAMNMVTCGAEP